MSSANLRRQDTTKGPPLRILCLDGGGVRGYSMLILLQELMHRTYVEVHGTAPKRHEIPKPCDHFDLIAGTGTGGLIALMLGRLRMDIETCKETYVRLTKRVFETDKTIAGIPYRSTLFKASKLEEAIRECVRQHTVLGDEGNDDEVDSQPLSPITPGFGASELPPRASSTMSRNSGPQGSHGGTGRPRVYGNPNALLYDSRETRTKTAVTAVYKGTSQSGSSTLLRSYDSRKEPAPEFNCRIWEAGRATSAIGLAFKPIQIGQSAFHDEGAGKFNPSPQILDEATINEWPSRDVGVFVTIGTGKRPASTEHRQAEWWEGFIGPGLGDFAEARRRLIAKIEGCEETHQYMLKDHLSKRGVNAENYYRLNVEVGVGEFAMNEWNRLSDISTNTRMYLGRPEVQNMIISASTKLSAILKAKIRWERTGEFGERPYSFDASNPQAETLAPPHDPMAAELSAGEFYELDTVRSRTNSMPLAQSQYQGQIYPPTSQDNQPSRQDPRPSYSTLSEQDYRASYASMSPISSPTVPNYPSNRSNYDSAAQPPPLHIQHRYGSVGSPPVPPKTPITASAEPNWPVSPRQSSGGVPYKTLPASLQMPVRPLPYPDLEGPPPEVNMARKPQLR